MTDKVTSAELVATVQSTVATLRSKIPAELLSDPDVSWPTKEMLNALKPQGLQRFFKLYINDEHIKVLEAAANHSSLNTFDKVVDKLKLLKGAELLRKDYMNAKVSDLVSDPENLVAAAPAPAASAKLAQTLAPAGAGGGAILRLPEPGTAKPNQTTPVQKVVYGSQPPAVTDVQNPPPPGASSSGKKDDTTTTGTGNEKIDELKTKLDKNPVLAGAGAALAIGFARFAAGGKVDLVMFTICGALLGFLYDKFAHNITADGQWKPNDHNRGCDPRHMQQQYYGNNQGPRVNVGINSFGMPGGGIGLSGFGGGLIR